MRFYWQMLVAPLGLALGGCAGLDQQQHPAPVVHYQCETGKSFSLSVSADAASATIEFDRMRFPLRAVVSAGGADESFACDVMTVIRNGPNARVDMDGESPFRSCVRVP